MFHKKVIGALVLSALVLPTIAIGQTSTAKAVYTAPKSDIEKIRDEGLNRSKVMETLSYLVDVIGPRLTNSPTRKRMDARHHGGLGNEKR